MKKLQIIAARKTLGLTQKELGAELGLTSTMIGMMENGRPVQRTTELAIKYLLLMNSSRG